MAKRIDRGFEIALATAILSDAPHVARKMGACLMDGPRVLSVGCNLYSRSHPASDNDYNYTVSTHAEHACLLRRQHYEHVGGLTLFVARRLADGSAGNSRPCPNCVELCRLAGVSRVWFYEHGVRKVLAPL